LTAKIHLQRRKENMETKQKVRLFLFATLALFSMVATSGAASFQLICGQKRTISEALQRLRSGDTLLVSGACNENVQIPEQVVNITLDGQRTATITGPDASSSTILVRGDGITIRNFATITGGQTGITVTRGGAALIDSNVIQNTGTNGIVVIQSSSARIINNTIQGNPQSGIVISESSSARIGFNMLDDTEARPNLIQNNKEDGIVVTRSSSARIVGNTISGNTENGVLITRVSHGDVSSNTINSNGGDGIFVSRNSGVNLGEDTGSGIFDSPNSTNSNNVGVGIRCAINSYGDGRIGTLNGASGPFSFVANCVNATIP
jgi:parallel beta-helix repeat protein